MREKSKKELSEPKMQELKKEALEFFHKWQESVISRVGTVVNSKETAVQQQEKPSAEATPETAAPPDTKGVSKYIALQDQIVFCQPLRFQ